MIELEGIGVFMSSMPIKGVIRIKLGNRKSIEVTAMDNELASADKLKQSNDKERSVRREVRTASLQQIQIQFIGV